VNAEGPGRPPIVTGNGEGPKPRESRLPAPSQASSRTLLLVAALVGIFGFAAARSDIYGSPVKKSAAYGSPEDFKKAIRDLQDTFGAEEDEVGDIVSTNPDVLHAHGFSTLAYHEGKARVSSMIGHNRNDTEYKNATFDC
jgi:D-lactate dehydrogenase (cytochrome)